MNFIRHLESKHKELHEQRVAAVQKRKEQVEKLKNSQPKLTFGPAKSSQTGTESQGQLEIFSPIKRPRSNCGSSQPRINQVLGVYFH